MKKLNYTITALEPLIITQNSDDPNMFETLHYIRGTVIQGLFSQLYLRSNKFKADEVFMNLIIKGGCRFLNAFPVLDGQKFYPSPLGIVKLKYPKNQDAKDSESNIKAYNLLLLDNFDEQTSSLPSMVAISEKKIIPFVSRKEIRLHNQIDDKNRTSEKGILFNYQSLPMGSVFAGSLLIENDSNEDLLKELISKNSNIRIGRSATAEYGKIKFDWTDTENFNPDDNERSETKNVILTLLSDTIVLNKNGFSSLDVNDLEECLFNATVIKSISRKNRIEGFLNVWKLRKPSENVFSAGSSFLLNNLPDNAGNLTTSGLGEKTIEGYGQVSFTWQDTEITEYYFSEAKKSGIEKPSQIPDLTKKIWTSALITRKKSTIIGEALEDANRSEIKSNHLIGKLKGMSVPVNDFAYKLGQLRKPAKEHLQKSYIGYKNLLEHFYHIIEKTIVLQVPDEQENIPVIIAELKELYFEQYFNQLRRNNKKSN
jgi:CRISPR/Cas system CSM-associated protein Csm3 (group 7 of RAMP superfamily)